MKNSRSFLLPPLFPVLLRPLHRLLRHSEPLFALSLPREERRKLPLLFFLHRPFLLRCRAVHRILLFVWERVSLRFSWPLRRVPHPHDLSLETPITPSRGAHLSFSFPSLLPQFDLMSTRSKSGSPSGDGKSKKRNRKVASCSSHFPSTSSSLPPRSRRTTIETPS
jgi:hypothetical protein